jgi:MinD-like ATPase involved in chromosome partitioning or flagellar assembly
MSRDEPAVALAASPRPWPQRLHRHTTDHGGARIRATVLTALEALAEHYDVLVVDDTTSFLSQRLVTELHEAGRAVLGLYDADDPRGKGELHDAGVDLALTSDSPPDTLVNALRSLARPRAGQAPQPRPPAARPARGPSALLLVGGPDGGCGRTEVALGLAVALVRAGKRVVLLEGDQRHPAFAARLGLAPYPNLRAALELARGGRGRTREALQSVAEGLDVLVGGPPSEQALTPSPDEAALLLDDLGAHGTLVVADIAQRRHPLLALAEPHAVVAVGAASPLGVLRLGEWLRQHGDPVAPPHVALNYAPESAFRRWEAAEELGRVSPPASLTYLPHDPRVTEAAWRGSPVLRGAFVKAVTRLARRIDAPHAPLALEDAAPV